MKLIFFIPYRCFESGLLQKRATTQEAQVAAEACHTGAAHRCVIELLQDVVTEFCPASASPLGLSWEYHDRCRMELETGFLRAFFLRAAGLAAEAVGSGAALAGQDQGDSLLLL